MVYTVDGVAKWGMLVVEQHRVQNHKVGQLLGIKNKSNS